MKQKLPPFLHEPPERRHVARELGQSCLAILAAHGGTVPDLRLQLIFQRVDHRKELFLRELGLTDHLQPGERLPAKRRAFALCGGRLCGTLVDKMSPKESDSTMAVYLDLENIALGARDAHFPAFDIQKVLERLLLKGHIVVKKAYCDFDRYKEFKRGLHEAAFELIEIPHVRQSGKNSADIRMVVDALDLCYTKGHVDTFAIISGDSDFSPLVSKLRENAKTVIGVGVKNSTSDLFINNCDEFLYYDDLVRREPSRARNRSTSAPSQAPSQQSSAPSAAAHASAPHASASTAAAIAAKATAPTEPKGPPLIDALELVIVTLEALTEEREGDEPIWGSMIKQTIKRRKPGFNERAYGFSSFNDLLLEAQKRNLIKLEADDKSGGYTVRVLE